MALQWMPQNLQKRLLRYILGQLSLFSEIDLPNVDVSLGISTNSKINLRDLQLDPDKFNLPGIYVRDGKICELELILTMSDGVNVDVDGLSLTIAIAQPHLISSANNEQFSLAKSTADLAQSVMFDNELNSEEDDNVINSESDLQESKDKEEAQLSSSPTKQQNVPESKMSSMMSKAVEIALGKLQVEIKNAKIIIIWDSAIYEAVIDQISFTSIDGVRNIDINGIHIALVKPHINLIKHDSNEVASTHEPEQDNNESTIKDKKLETKEEYDDDVYHEDDEDDDDDDDPDYNEEMMSSSFMVDASTKEEKASIMDSMMFSNENSSMFMTATSKVFRSKSVMFDNNSNDPESEDDNSDTPLDEDKIKVDELKLKRKDSTMTFIDNVSLSFEGLQDISNLNVEVGTVKSSAVSLTAAVAYVVKSLKQASKLSQQLGNRNSDSSQSQQSSTTKRNNEPATALEKLNSANSNGLQKTPETPKDNMIENISILRIMVSTSSPIDGTGEFIDEDTITLMADNLVFSQRSSQFSYGSIETIKIIKGNTDIFHFDQPTKKSSQMNDLKFETLQGDDIPRTTLLCSKTAIFNVDFTTLSELTELYRTIAPFIEMLSSETNEQTQKYPSPSSLRHSPRNQRGIGPTRLDRYSGFQSPGTKEEGTPSEFNAQTSSIILNLQLSDSMALKATILPLDFSSSKGELETTRLTVEYAIKNGDTSFIKPLLLINEIKYTSIGNQLEKIRVKSYDTNTFQEIINDALKSLTIESIDINSDYQTIQLLINTVQELDLNSLQITNQKASGGASSKNVRLGASIFSRPQKLIDFHLLIKSIEISLTDITKEFGDLNIKGDTLGVNAFKDADMTLVFLQKISMDRFYNGDSVEPVIYIANRDFGGNTPLVLAKLRSSSNSVYLKNLALNYYGIWFKYFEDNDKSSYSSPAENETYLQSGQSSASKSKMNFQLVFSDISIGLNPVNLNSKAELVINKATGELSFFDNSKTTFQLSSRSVNLLLIDDTGNILSDADSRNYRQWLSNQPGSGNIANWTLLSVLKSKGFAQVGKINNLSLNVTIKPDAKFSTNSNKAGNSSPPANDNTNFIYALTELNVGCSTLNVDLCADSSQCMMQLFKDLKDPVQFTTDEKFKSDTPEVNVFQDIDIDQYSTRKEKVPTSLSVSHTAAAKPDNSSETDTEAKEEEDEEEEDDDDDVLSDSPLNIVEDFYNNGTDVETATSLRPLSSSDTLHNSGSNGVPDSTRQISSVSGGGILKNSNSVKPDSKGNSIYFDDDHFKKLEETDLKRRYPSQEIKVKVIPMAIVVEVPKTIIHLFDGYDWKTTQVEIRKAIKRVETKAAAEVERRKLESKSISNTPNSTIPSDNSSSSNVVTFAESERRLSNSSIHARTPTRPSGTAETNGSLYSSTNSSNISLDNEDDDIIGEFLYGSIMLGVKAGQNPSKLSERIDRSINFIPSNDYDTSDTISFSSPSPAPSNSSINHRKLSANGATNSNISLGKASGKKLRLKRSRQYKVSIELTKLVFDMKIMTNDEPHIKTRPAFFSKDANTDDSELVNSMTITVDDFQILDNVPTSTWNLFTGYLREAGDREVDVSMAKIKIDTVRPISSLAATELVLNISILPLRLYVDQDTLDFLTRFGEFKDTRFIPNSNSSEEDEEIFIEKIQVDAVKIKLDYKPKKVDYAGIKSGHTSEFMNFFILDESVMTLRKIVLYGVPGFSRLNTLLNDSWMPDIKGTQLSGVLSGLAPVKSIVKIGSGFRELVAVPVKEYNKDKRVMRSLQKGVSSFAKITGNELLKFGVKLAAGTQVILENAEEVLGGDGSSARLYIDKDGDSIKGGNVTISKKGRKGSSESITGLIGKKNTVHRGSMNSYNGRDDSSDDDDEGNEHADLVNASIFVDSLSGDYYLYRPDESAIETGDAVDRDGKGDTGLDIDGDDNEDNEEEEDESEDQRVISLYSNQPVNFNDGMKNAYESFGKNMSTAKKAILKASSRAAESGSAQTAVKEIAKATPVMVIRPIIGTTEAISKALLGGINNLDPEEKKKSEEKYKRLK